MKAAKKIVLSEEHGATHLAEAHRGRAPEWRVFKDALDAVKLSEVEEALAVAGAEAALARLRELVAEHLA